VKPVSLKRKACATSTWGFYLNKPRTLLAESHSKIPRRNGKRKRKKAAGGSTRKSLIQEKGKEGE